ncbi:hypothetical protein HDU85_005920 [Gaertneriomyces sp. JEL0708]|nr:hypothetical protein HDU85_005920 [Gaertneriomyces sp. JEL0708]
MSASISVMPVMPETATVKPESKSGKRKDKSPKPKRKSAKRDSNPSYPVKMVAFPVIKERGLNQHGGFVILRLYDCNGCMYEPKFDTLSQCRITNRWGSASDRVSLSDLGIITPSHLEGLSADDYKLSYTYRLNGESHTVTDVKAVLCKDYDNFEDYKRDVGRLEEMANEP